MVISDGPDQGVLRQAPQNGQDFSRLGTCNHKSRRPMLFLKQLL